MKKLLITLSLLGAGAVALTASASYYYNTYTVYNPSYGARASYTIGCTTYYYNPYTGASMGQEQICYTYTPSYAYAPGYTYQYDYYYTQPTPYYTYEYNTNTGGWYPGAGYAYNDYWGCYWQNGYQVCY